MPLHRAAWLVTVLVAVVTGAVLLVKGYNGYGALSFVIGASAAINLH